MAPIFTGFRFGFGGGASASGFSVTGGTILIPGDGYVYHNFIAPGIFQVNSNSAFTFEFLVVAGGGAGGVAQGGGGGAGGIVNGSYLSLAPSSYHITVGSGGPAGTSPRPTGSSGGDGFDSEIVGLALAKGGGGGAGYNGSGSPGGSGGAGINNGSAGTATQPTTPNPNGTNHGNNGAPGGPAGSNGCGGGGAGAAGAAGFSGNNGNGGAGEPFPSFKYPDAFPAPLIPGLSNPSSFPASPTTDHYGGGGSGGSRSPHGSPQAGGIGGGGRGTPGPSPATVYPGASYLGGGGGGGSSPGTSLVGNVGGNGGPGVVIIRYEE